MFDNTMKSGSTVDDYKLMLQQLKLFLDDETNFIANLSNIAALLNFYLEDINWVGFYIKDSNDELVLGPFQGLPACVRIKIGSGVCGTAFSENKTQRVPDVHAFPGHIACDSASNSEIVVPLVSNKSQEVIGVLDIDSPKFDRFSETDQEYLEKIVELIGKYY